MGGRGLMKMFYSGFTICNIHCNNKPQHCKCCCKPQKSNKGFHKLFNKLAILDRITIIKTNKITSRATNIKLLNMGVKLLYNHAENGANKANAIVKSSLYTPISSLIFSLVIKAKHLLCFVIFLSSIFVNQSFANHQTHCDLNFGYHFYCNDGVEVEEEIALQPKQKEQKNHKAELEQMKQELEARKAKAVVEPNEDNVKEYMVYQKKVLENSAKFADVWRRVLWKHPELDYTVKHPTNTLAKHKQIDVKREDIKSSLLSLSERYGLFFVYKSTCPYCHQYSPILKEFSTVYNIDILPITLDGISIKEWEGNTIKDLSVLKKLGLEDISQVPATVLFDNQTKEVLPVGYGILSISDLEDRIYMLINPNGDEGF
jgi:conjugal transfer pilus assembly protein TraF